MMRKTSILIFILVFIVHPWMMKGQEPDEGFSQSVLNIRTAPSVLFNKVIVHLRKGGSFVGLLVGIQGDRLIIRIKEKDKKIHINSLERVRIETEKNTRGSVLCGMFTGAYLGNFIFFRAKNQPPVYMEKFYERGLVFLNFAFAAAGGGIGFLTSLLLEKKENTFNFTGSEKKRQAEWEGLKRFIISGSARRKKLNLSIQGGHVFTQVSPRYSNLLRDAGYHITNTLLLSFFWEDYEWREEAISFNLLRKFQLTVSPLKNLETGFALYWLGEPSMYANQVIRHETENYTIAEISVDQKTNTTGYYATGIYKPFFKNLPKFLEWNVGLGLGVAKVNFKLKSLIYRVHPPSELLTYEHNISKIRFSSLIFTELRFYPRDDLSFGLAADYVFIPSEEALSIPEADIPAQKLRLGTGSIGFTLGLHF